MGVASVLRAIRRPTLARRVLASLLLSFALVEGTLLAVDFAQYKQVMATHPGLQQLADVLAPTLAPLPEDAAVHVARASLAQWNALRRRAGVLPGELALRLRRQDGSEAFASAVLAGVRLPTLSRERAELALGGRGYWIAQANAGPWRLELAEPSVGDGWMLGWLLQDLSGRVLLAFPLVLVPMWVTARGGIRPLRELARALASRRGDDLSPVAVDMHYAELRPVAEAFDVLLLRLRHHVRRERAFVQDAAHELRTPVAAIAAQAHVLAHADDPRERAQAARALDHAVARASHLGRQLLALAALDEARPRGDERLDVAAVVQGLVAVAAPAAFERGIELALDAPEHLPWCLDRAALESALGNLLDNAVRYGRAGGRAVVTLAADGDALHVAVADDGPGIPPALRDRAFERFWRGAGHDIPGSGLGLSIVREAVERLHGQIRVDDGLDGRGVAIHVRVPA
jgi:signal transduction histidine kinase